MCIFSEFKVNKSNDFGSQVQRNYEHRKLLKELINPHRVDSYDVGKETRHHADFRHYGLSIIM